MYPARLQFCSTCYCLKWLSLVNCTASANESYLYSAADIFMYALVCLARQMFEFGHYTIELAENRGISIAMVM